MEEVAFYLTVRSCILDVQLIWERKTNPKHPLSYYNGLWPSKAQPTTTQSYSFMSDFFH